MNGQDRLDDLSFYSFLAVLQSGMWLQADIDKYLAQYGLSHGRFSILLAIVDSPDGNAIGNDLATRLGISKPTVTKMVAKLVHDGYIVQKRDPTDSRKKTHTVAPKAVALLESIIPEYVARLRSMTACLSNEEKVGLLETLPKIDFLDPRKTILRQRQKTIAEKGAEIRELCKRGTSDAIDQVLAYLDAGADIPTTKLVDFYLGTVSNAEGLRRIEHYLFYGTQVQRNYCMLFFARNNEWKLVNKAYETGLIDGVQAYSR